MLFVSNIVSGKHCSSGIYFAVPQAERLSRLQRMIDLQREITLKKFQAQIGKEVVVYIET
jgi:tRNA A37 methylthiotransferase MiaB